MLKTCPEAIGASMDQLDLAYDGADRAKYEEPVFDSKPSKRQLVMGTRLPANAKKSREQLIGHHKSQRAICS